MNLMLFLPIVVWALVTLVVVGSCTAAARADNALGLD